jgi:hypothetical protein
MQISPMNFSSIYPDYSQEQARLRLLLQRYKDCPPHLAFGQMAIKMALVKAEHAAESGDRVLMSRAYHAMQEIE